MLPGVRPWILPRCFVADIPSSFSTSALDSSRLLCQDSIVSIQDNDDIRAARRCAYMFNSRRRSFAHLIKADVWSDYLARTTGDSLGLCTNLQPTSLFTYHSLRSASFLMNDVQTRCTRQPCSPKGLALRWLMHGGARLIAARPVANAGVRWRVNNWPRTAKPERCEHTTCVFGASLF